MNEQAEERTIVCGMWQAPAGSANDAVYAVQGRDGAAISGGTYNDTIDAVSSLLDAAGLGYDDGRVVEDCPARRYQFFAKVAVHFGLVGKPLHVLEVRQVRDPLYRPRWVVMEVRCRTCGFVETR